ncbi:MAG: hypothetical protein OEO21_11390 [Candidatus Krumholzibacteria bacterium]|nr:hypothetical protein [Candidatus Krumholzibacteria bacterium]
MMHCTMDQLLAERDGEGSPWARQHVAECAECRAELQALHQRGAGLRALPGRRPSRDRWPAVRGVLAAERRARSRRTVTRWMGLAAAATLAGLVATRAFGPAVTPVYAADLALAKEASATLEEQLAAWDGPGRVMSGREAAIAAELEDRIAVIDGALPEVTHEARLLELWQQRVELMQQLYTVRVTRAAYVAF